MPALREFAVQTEDTALRRQIEERLAYETLLRERFESNDGSFFYVVAEIDGKDETTAGHYASAKAALVAGKAGGSPFCVSKYQLVDLRRKLITPQARFNPRMNFSPSVQVEPYFGRPVAEYHYDAGGVLQRYWSEETAPEERDRVEDWGAARFEDRFVLLPNPFELGDIVCMTDAPEQVGVVETSQEGWRIFLERVRAKPWAEDFQDASITVEFLMENGEFSHSHILPIFLDRVKLDETDARKPLLEAASCLIRGTGALDVLFWIRKDYLTATGREKKC